jgi:ribose transport system permease protein
MSNNRTPVGNGWPFAESPDSRWTAALGAWVRSRHFGQEQIVIVIALVLAAVFGATVPGFATWSNAMALLRSVSVLGVFALGMTVVMIGRGIDLSQIAVALVSAGIVLKLIIGGMTLSTALVAGFAIALTLGLLNGAIVAYLAVPPLLATLASALVFVGFARALVLQSTIINLPPDNTALLALGGNWRGVPVPLIVFAACALSLHLFLSRTTPGRFIYAHGDNADTARLSGLPVNRLTLLEYALCAAIGYAGGLVTVASTGLVDLQAVNATQIFDIILVGMLGGVSLMGGRGSVWSVIAGTLLIGVLLDGMTIMDLNYQLQNIIKGGVLLAAVILDRWIHPQDEETARQGI